MRVKSNPRGGYGSAAAPGRDRNAGALKYLSNILSSRTLLYVTRDQHGPSPIPINQTIRVRCDSDSTPTARTGSCAISNCTTWTCRSAGP